MTSARVASTPYVFFDLDDTLLDHQRASLNGASVLFERYPALAALGRETFLARWPVLTEKHMDRYFAGQVDFPEQRRARMRELFAWVSADVDDAAADDAFDVYVTAYGENFRAFDDVEPCLVALERAAVPIGVITNGRIIAQTKKLEALGLLDRVHAILVTEEIGVHKPDPRVFAEAARRARRPIDECVYVGDKRETDALAAQAAGMRGIWLDRPGRSIPPSEPVTSAEPGPPRITNLSGLPAALGL